MWSCEPLCHERVASGRQGLGLSVSGFGFRVKGERARVRVR